MPHRDTRPRYRVLQPIPKKHHRPLHLRVGTAYRNPDGTIDVVLDAIIVGERFQLVEEPPGAKIDFESDPEATDPELLS